MKSNATTSWNYRFQQWLSRKNGQVFFSIFGGIFLPAIEFFILLCMYVLSIEFLSVFVHQIWKTTVDINFNINVPQIWKTTIHINFNIYVPQIWKTTVDNNSNIYLPQIWNTTIYIKFSLITLMVLFWKLPPYTLAGFDLRTHSSSLLCGSRILHWVRRKPGLCSWCFFKSKSKTISISTSKTISIST
jgi:hypothetical protein